MKDTAAPTFDVVGNFSLAPLAEHLVDALAIIDDMETPPGPEPIDYLQQTVGTRSISAMRGRYGRVAAIVYVNGHPVGKSVKRMLRSLVRATPPAAANDAPRVEVVQ